MKLVLCPGHGVNLRPADAARSDAWVGIHPGEAGLLVEHARAAVERVHAEPDSRLVFSGGATRAAAGELSEASSYLHVAQHAGWWGAPEVAERTLLEEFARDSLENVAFALARFRVDFGTYPTGVVVVGWAFKRERFLAHARALRWPSAFDYVGVNDPPAAGGALAAARRGEARKRAALARDPLLRGESWRDQRAARDPLGRREPYSAALPALAPFLRSFDPDRDPPDWIGAPS